MRPQKPDTRMDTLPIVLQPTNKCQVRASHFQRADHHQRQYLELNETYSRVFCARRLQMEEVSCFQ